MRKLCKHCASSFKPTPSLEEFCCRGCERVYTLIREGGLGGYYRLQDRAAEPLKDRSLGSVNREAFKSIQLEAEASLEVPELALSVDGMSCMGCSWLIERIGRNQLGIRFVRVSLARNVVTFAWQKGEFDLAQFATVLSEYGYELGNQLIDREALPKLTSLAVRVLLVSVFWVNALLLAAFEYFVAPSLGGSLLHLLSLACFMFACLIGVSPFLMTIYRAVFIRRIHSDLVPVVGLILFLAVLGILRTQGELSLTLGGFLSVTLVLILIFARWLSTLVGRFCGF